ncbi:hypothetical protein CCP1ISM_50041 [Azospirillaceae bacterium]
MKTHSVAEALRHLTGILIREYEIIRWADEGLLGEVSRFNQVTEIGKQRNFNDKNFERAVLVVFFMKIMNMPWSKEQLKKHLDTNDKLMERQVEMSLDTLEARGIPRLKHILLERKEKSGN